MSRIDEPGKPLLMPCYAVRVRSRGELFVANLLRQKDFQVLAPTFTKLRRYSDRVSKVTAALFPGYIFVRLCAEDMLRLVSTDGVSYVVGNSAITGSLSDQETLAIEALCSGTESREPCAYLRVGQRVKVESGPFFGIEGVLAKVRDATRVVITVHALCSSVSVEIDADRLRLLDEGDIAMGGNDSMDEGLASKSRLPVYAQ